MGDRVSLGFLGFTRAGPQAFWAGTDLLLSPMGHTLSPGAVHNNPGLDVVYREEEPKFKWGPEAQNPETPRGLCGLSNQGLPGVRSSKPAAW